MKKRSRSLQTLLVPLCLFAITIAALMFYSAQAKKRAEQMTGEVLLAAASEKNDLLTAKLDTEFLQLSILAASLGEDGGFSAETTAKLSLPLEGTHFSGLILLDTSAEGVLENGQSVQLGEYAFVQSGLAGGRAAGYMENISFGMDGAAVVLVVPVLSGGHVGGALVGILDEGSFFAQFSENAFDGSRTYLYTAEGTPVFGGESLYQQASIQPEANEFREISVEGVRWYIASVSADYGDWLVCRAIPAERVDASVRQEKAMGYHVIGVAMASVIFAVLLIIRGYHKAIGTSRRERERLAAVEEDYRIATQQGRMMILRIDIESGEILSRSGLLEHQYIFEKPGKIDAEWLLNELVGEESREEFAAFVRAVSRGDDSGNAEINMKNSDGQFRWYSMEFTAIGNGGGKHTQAIITIRDITLHHQRIAAFRRWQNAMAASVDVSAALMEINLTTGACERVEGEFALINNPESGQIAVERVLDQFCQENVARDDREKFLQFVSIQRLIGLHRQGQQADETEIHLLNSDGSPRQCILTVQMADMPRNDEVKAFLMLKDFENISREMERLSDLALRDGLTGLLNRTAARSAIEESLLFGSGDKVALFMIDADRFKRVNDLLGHQHGDHALKQMSEVIRKTFRSTDVVARIGGDEFFVFLSEVPGDEFAENKAIALCENLRFTYAVEERGTISLSASVGIIVAERGSCDYEGLYKEADLALYEAKRGGKNRYSIRYSGQARSEKSSGAALNSSALQLNSLLRHLDGGVVMLEIGEQIEPLFISEGYFMKQGLMREAIEAHAFPRSVVHPTDYPRLEEAIRTCAVEGEPFQISYRNALAGGGYGWRHMNALRAPNPRGKNPVVIAVISDITDLHNATERLESLAADSQIGILIIRVGERIEITFFNDGALSMSGFQYEQMRIFSRDASAFFRGDNLARFRAEIAAADAENRMADFLYQSHGFVGKEAHSLHFYGVKLDVQNGVPSYLIIMLEQKDIQTT